MQEASFSRNVPFCICFYLTATAQRNSDVDIRPLPLTACSWHNSSCQRRRRQHFGCEQFGLLLQLLTWRWCWISKVMHGSCCDSTRVERPVCFVLHLVSGLHQLGWNVCWVCSSYWQTVALLCTRMWRSTRVPTDPKSWEIVKLGKWSENFICSHWSRKTLDTLLPVQSARISLYCCCILTVEIYSCKLGHNSKIICYLMMVVMISHWRWGEADYFVGEFCG